MPRSATLVLVLLAACTGDLPPQYLVTDLRILALRSTVEGAAGDVADADRGEQIRLDALVANPRGHPDLTVTWLACLPTATDALPPCLDPAYLRAPERLLADPRALVLGTGVSLVVPGAALQAQLDAAVAQAFDGLVARATSDPAYQCQLYVELPVVALATAGDRRELAVKRVRLTPVQQVAGTPLEGGYVRNANPLVLDVRLDPSVPDECSDGASVVVPCDASASCAPGEWCGGDGLCAGSPFPQGSHLLCARPRPGAIQTFERCASDGTREPVYETLSWQWYVTAGRIDDAGTIGNAGGDHALLSRDPGAFTVWVVLRDGRGGVSWASRDYPAVP